jgi:hypothetical protein
MQMRKIIQLLEAATDVGAKLDRTAFIYLEPKSNAKDFAQCKTCFMFMPGKQRCSIFGKDDKVIAAASCSLYVQGQPNDDQEILSSVTPEAAGYVEAQVRCENCRWLDGTDCRLYATLQQNLPDVFDLEITVDPKACCNAWQA